MESFLPVIGLPHGAVAELPNLCPALCPSIYLLPLDILSFAILRNNQVLVTENPLPGFEFYSSRFQSPLSSGSSCLARPPPSRML